MENLPLPSHQQSPIKVPLIITTDHTDKHGFNPPSALAFLIPRFLSAFRLSPFESGALI
jgi:hypothetical protein